MGKKHGCYFYRMLSSKTPLKQNANVYGCKPLKEDTGLNKIHSVRVRQHFISGRLFTFYPI